jgi:hypothetical protein
MFENDVVIHRWIGSSTSAHDSEGILNLWLCGEIAQL